jgi:hypothetical protein
MHSTRASVNTRKFYLADSLALTLMALTSLLCVPQIVPSANGLSTKEIQRLSARYNVDIDSGDVQAYAATFTADGVFNIFNCHDALVGSIKTWRERLNGADNVGPGGKLD